VRDIGCNRRGQTGLTRSPHPEQCHQTMLREHFGNLCNLNIATE